MVSDRSYKFARSRGENRVRHRRRDQSKGDVRTEIKSVVSGTKIPDPESDRKKKRRKKS